MEFILITHGEDALAAKFNAGAEAATDPLEPIVKIVEDIFRVEEAIFSSQGRRGGGSWKGLQPDTIAKKGSGRILEDTGKLRESLTVPGAEFQILEITKTGFEFGTDRPFAAVQQYGSIYNNRPARPFMKFTPNDIGRWNSWLMEHLMAPFAK